MEGFAPHGRVGGRHPVLKDLQPGQFFREQVRGVGRHPPQIGGGDVSSMTGAANQRKTSISSMHPHTPGQKVSCGPKLVPTGRCFLCPPPQPPLKCSCRPTANRPAAPRVGAQRDDRRCGVAGRRRRPRRTSRALVVIVQLPRILLEFSCGHPFVSRQPFQNFASRPTDPVWLCNEPHRSPRTGFSKTFAA
jgi:hypothetical protein